MSAGGARLTTLLDNDLVARLERLRLKTRLINHFRKQKLGERRL